MIRVAAIGYAQQPLFDLLAPNQPTMNERIAWVFQNDETFREVARREGIDVDKVLVAWERERRRKTQKIDKTERKARL
jgi:peroxisomal coenzyme A diphosphatase NUDT7